MTRIKLFLAAVATVFSETLYRWITQLMAREGLVRYAVIAPTSLTYGDWAKRVNDDGKTAMIIELLSQTNPILDDMLVVEANNPVSHRTTVRTGLPTATWRLLNYGVPRAKSTTAQVTDGIGMLEVYSEIDKSLADLNGNTAAFRLSEDMAFLEGMSQQMATTVFYGNTAVNPERFMGLSPRYNTTSSATAQTALNVIDAGGTGSTNTSIWVVTWGPNTMHGIFPKGQISGLQQKDMGEWPLQDAAGNLYQGYRTHFKWDQGMSVRDWRYAVRIANIDVTLLSGGSAANLINALIRAVNRLPTAAVGVTNVQNSDTSSIAGSMGRTVIYCNRVIQTYLEIQAINKTNVLLSIREVPDGRVITTFRGIPVRPCDALVNTESRVV